MINKLKKLRQYGLLGSIHIILTYWKKKIILLIALWQCRNAPKYVNPSQEELANIETNLIKMGVKVHDYSPSQDEFRAFKDENWFPPDYHGGLQSSVWDEKLLEHWIASKLLNLESYDEGDVYVDVAASRSPWVRSLRERTKIAAYAIDLCPIKPEYKKLFFYRVENATQTSFGDSSVTGVSLHCAYEMFMGDDDIKLLYEIARILKSGGKVVILPLYMHTHYCAYSTPEFYGKGYSNVTAKEYVRSDCAGIPSSRKYDVSMLKSRVLDNVNKLGLQYKLYVLKNKSGFGNNIYCHFILEITK